MTLDSDQSVLKKKLEYRVNFKGIEAGEFTGSGGSTERGLP
jgi:hypothetical protein